MGSPAFEGLIDSGAGRARRSAVPAGAETTAGPPVREGRKGPKGPKGRRPRTEVVVDVVVGLLVLSLVCVVAGCLVPERRAVRVRRKELPRLPLDWSLWRNRDRNRWR